MRGFPQFILAVFSIGLSDTIYSCQASSDAVTDVFVYSVNRDVTCVQDISTCTGTASLLTYLTSALKLSFPSATVTWTRDPSVYEDTLSPTRLAAAAALPGTTCELFPVPINRHVPMITLTSAIAGPVPVEELWFHQPVLEIVSTAHPTGVASLDNRDAPLVEIPHPVPGTAENGPGQLVTLLQRSLLDHHRAESDEDVLKAFAQFTGKRVIAFSLWLKPPRPGHAQQFNPKKSFVRGLVANIQLRDKYFPNWTVRIYHDDSLTNDTIEMIRLPGTELVRVSDMNSGASGSMWRFLVASDPSVDYYIIRDADSRFSMREVHAVREWIDSGKRIHRMNEVRTHNHEWLAGTWGGTRDAVPNMDKLLEEFREIHPANKYGVDQKFLYWLWSRNLVNTSDVVFHDGWACRNGATMFPTQRPSDMTYVGFVVEHGALEYSGPRNTSQRNGCSWWTATRGCRETGQARFPSHLYG